MITKLAFFGTKLVLAVLVFNWIVAEIEIFAPGAKDLVVSVTEQIAIPTHEEFKSYEISSFSDLGDKFDQLLASAGDSGVLAKIRDFTGAGEEKDQLALNLPVAGDLLGSKSSEQLIDSIRSNLHTEATIISR